MSPEVHQVLVYAASVLIGTGLLLMFRLIWRGGAMLGRLEKHVLPHFEPPSPEEIRAGAEDRTIPARIANQECALKDHLDDEEIAAKALYERMGRIESAVLADAHATGAAAHREHLATASTAHDERAATDERLDRIETAITDRET